MNRDQQIERALTLYSGAVTLLDPIRLWAWSDLGLTLPTLKVLFLLKTAPGAPSGVIAGRLGVTPSTITGLVDRLVHQQLVRREEDPRDRRLVRNFLTDAGLTTAGDLERQARNLIAGIFAELSDAALERLILALSDLLGAASSHAGQTPALA